MSDNALVAIAIGAVVLVYGTVILAYRWALKANQGSL